MSNQMNVFVTEGNVEIYLSRLHSAWDSETRDVLLRLLIAEEEKMGESRVHFENGERRVSDGRQRLQRQREIVQGLEPTQQEASRAALLLETLEKTQELLEGHLQLLQERFGRNKL